MSKTIQECDKLAGKSFASNRKTINDALFVVPIEKDGDVLQLEITADTFLTSKKPISAVETNATKFSQNQLPDMFPLKYTISMPQANIYQLRDIYRKLNFTWNVSYELISSMLRYIAAMTNTSGYPHPHTIFLHFSTMDVRNLHETPVTETQYNSRSMIKAFAVAASRARALYGVSW